MAQETIDRPVRTDDSTTQIQDYFDLVDRLEKRTKKDSVKSTHGWGIATVIALLSVGAATALSFASVHVLPRGFGGFFHVPAFPLFPAVAYAGKRGGPLASRLAVLACIPVLLWLLGPPVELGDVNLHIVAWVAALEACRRWNAGWPVWPRKWPWRRRAANSSERREHWSAALRLRRFPTSA
ncbi:MAG TPA: hypothetical protein VEQ62_17670 [Stellaceae bacterium]|jgi:hypothetical protein|nr:hypothetical protein [Stellaceae bacterium]